MDVLHDVVPENDPIVLAQFARALRQYADAQYFQRAVGPTAYRRMIEHADAADARVRYLLSTNA